MRLGAFALSLWALAGCGTADPVSQIDRAVAQALAPPEYLGIETRLLDADLVNFLVEVRNPGGTDVVETYARCAAAQYALIRGYGFARHVRTRVQSQASTWQGDAVYTISPSLPAGLRTIDAEETVADCTQRGIPTV